MNIFDIFIIAYLLLITLSTISAPTANVGWYNRGSFDKSEQLIQVSKMWIVFGIKNIISYILSWLPFGFVLEIVMIIACFYIFINIEQIDPLINKLIKIVTRFVQKI